MSLARSSRACSPDRGSPGFSIFGNLDRLNFPNHPVLAPFCLLVLPSVYLSPLGFSYKQQEEPGHTFHAVPGNLLSQISKRITSKFCSPPAARAPPSQAVWPSEQGMPSLQFRAENRARRRLSAEKETALVRIGPWLLSGIGEAPQRPRGPRGAGGGQEGPFLGAKRLGTPGSKLVRDRRNGAGGEAAVCPVPTHGRRGGACSPHG